MVVGASYTLKLLIDIVCSLYSYLSQICRDSQHLLPRLHVTEDIRSEHFVNRGVLLLNGQVPAQRTKCHR
eukprot:5190839-Pleurochrysis_carterae.AAC.4